MIRELKYYRWIFDKGKVVLFDKRKNIGFPLNMLMADSFVRAWISFKNRQRVEEKDKLRLAARKQREKYQARTKALREKRAKK